MTHVPDLGTIPVAILSILKRAGIVRCAASGAAWITIEMVCVQALSGLGAARVMFVPIRAVEPQMQAMPLAARFATLVAGGAAVYATILLLASHRLAVDLLRLERRQAPVT